MWLLGVHNNNGGCSQCCFILIHICGGDSGHCLSMHTFIACYIRYLYIILLCGLILYLVEIFVFHNFCIQLFHVNIFSQVNKTNIFCVFKYSWPLKVINSMLQWKNPDLLMVCGMYCNCEWYSCSIGWASKV